VLQYPSVDIELLRTFVAINEHGGFTRAAQMVNRTQSAVSMQMKRLENDLIGRPLFQRAGRQQNLTTEGQVLLDYARRILSLHSEMLNTLREPQMAGSVRIGTPDDYVMRFMQGILMRFAQSYPLVQVELHCEPSYNLLQRQDLDLTIVTREPGNEIGQLLRREPLVWTQARDSQLHQMDPLPLALFNYRCFCRTWACHALEAASRNYRVAYTSPSLSAIMAAVTAGLAISAQLRSLIGAELCIIGSAQGLPDLPSASIVLLRNQRTTSPASEVLAGHIVEGFKP
jgi:DNA-binding transcriptional LysR family regulator